MTSLEKKVLSNQDQQSISVTKAYTSLGNGGHPRHFYCIHCLTPSDSLYLQRGYDIQLTLCSACTDIVDPYCEREMLLVIMDIILLRPQAYRHAFLNHLPSYLQESWPIHTGSVLAISCLVEAIYSVLRKNESTNELLKAAILTSLLEQFTRIGSTWVSCCILLGSPLELRRLIFAHSLSSLARSGISLILRVWEATETVYLLGSFVSMAWQFLSLLSLVDEAHYIQHSLPKKRVGFSNKAWTALVLTLTLAFNDRNILIPLCTTTWTLLNHHRTMTPFLPLISSRL